MSDVEVWTDGSGTSKGPWGSAAILRFVDSAGGVHQREVLAWGHEGTNNVGELIAVIVGLEALTRPCDVTVMTDSEYVMFGFAPCDGYRVGRVERWRARGWVTASEPRRPVANRELWERLGALVERHRVRWRHVKGHSGIELNERADTLAGEARRRAIAELAVPDTADEKAEAVPV